MIEGNFNRFQAIKYVKKAFNTVADDEEFDPDTLFLASIANSLIYLGDSISHLNKKLNVDIVEELVENVGGETASASRS